MWVMRIDHASSPLLPVDGDLQQVSDRCSCDGRDIPTEVKARSASPIAAPFRQVESIARDRQMGCPDPVAKGAQLSCFYSLSEGMVIHSLQDLLVGYSIYSPDIKKNTITRSQERIDRVLHSTCKCLCFTSI